MTLKITNARLSFPSLFNPQDYQGDGNFKFKATLLIPRGDPQAAVIKKALIEALREKVGARAEKVFNDIYPNPMRCCFQDGDYRSANADKPSTYEAYAGMFALSANNKARPSIFDQDGRTPLVEQDGKPYAGCYVNAFVDVYAYNNGGWGVSAGLGGVQFLRDGDSFGGTARVAAGMFDDMSEGAHAEDMV